ncbi:MAG: hypothetical protein Q7S58_02800, partial [Candidatus Binatus sp.]|nr:hypothetical protein [Candidatus Binatus sp.]
ILEPASEAREFLTLAALEANPTVALAKGYRRDHPASRVIRSGTGIDGRGTTFLHIIRKAESAHHIAILLALPVHITDILLAGGARVAELETDAVAFQDIALAIGDSVINEATRRGAERVPLIFANHEGRLCIERRIQVEAEC